MWPKYWSFSLIYNIVLISGAQQSDSVIIYIYPRFKIFFSIMVYHSILNIVLCAIQQNLVFWVFLGFLAVLLSRWDLSSPTVKAQCPNHWVLREGQRCFQYESVCVKKSQIFLYIYNVMELVYFTTYMIGATFHVKIASFFLMTAQYSTDQRCHNLFTQPCTDGLVWLLTIKQCHIEYFVCTHR